MSKLLIRFWVLDDDTNMKKYGSPWFDPDTQREEMDAWISGIPEGRRFTTNTKYIKE